jgi:hypothetical protein
MMRCAAAVNTYFVNLCRANIDTRRPLTPSIPACEQLPSPKRLRLQPHNSNIVRQRLLSDSSQRSSS